MKHYIDENKTYKKKANKNSAMALIVVFVMIFCSFAQSGLSEQYCKTKYVVTFEVGQSHFTLDIGRLLKDEMNKITFEIPVDQEYFDSIDIGTVISDEFRMGSLIMAGSFGNWKIVVKDKEVRFEE